MPLVSRTRATLRRAEFGFLGVAVQTRVQTPRRWGAPFRAGVLPLAGLFSRPLRTSCWMVGTNEPQRWAVAGRARARRPKIKVRAAPVPGATGTGGHLGLLWGLAGRFL